MAATVSATAARTFHQEWQISGRVIMTYPPFRTGVIRSVQGVGPRAVIVVILDGSGPVNFYPYQLNPT